MFILQECVFQGVIHTGWQLPTRGFKRASDANTQSSMGANVELQKKDTFF